jgi:hypothetical protein
MIDPRIYLASRSPRRSELLEQNGVRFDLLMFRSAPREDEAPVLSVRKRRGKRGIPCSSEEARVLGEITVNESQPRGNASKRKERAELAGMGVYYVVDAGGTLEILCRHAPEIVKCSPSGELLRLLVDDSPSLYDVRDDR